MKKLIICEKKSVGMDYCKALEIDIKDKGGYCENNEYIVSWAMGHLFDIKEPEEINEVWKKWSLDTLPITIDYFNDLKVSSFIAFKKQYNVLKELINRNDISELICAGDADREGLLIQFNIYRKAKNKHKIKIEWLDDLSVPSIKKNFLKKQYDFNVEFQNLLYEGECRAISDYLYGMNFSRLFSCKYDNNFSYGRCQTPTLYLLNEREKEIGNFKEEEYFEVEALFKANFKGVVCEKVNNGYITKKWLKCPKNEVEQAVIGFNKSLIVESYNEEEKYTKAPNLFSLIDLQKECSKKYHFSAQKTLDICQDLYLGHFISYPRTDARCITNEVWGEIKEGLHLNNALKVLNLRREDLIIGDADKTYVKELKNSSHFAIIPGLEDKDISSLNDDQKKVYVEICKRFISILLKPYKYKSVSCIFKGVFDNLFVKSNSNTPLDFGWKVLYKDDVKINKESESENEEDSFECGNIPKFNVGESVLVDNYNILSKTTKCPARFSEATLLALLEKYNIGRPSSYAEILEKLFKRGYIEKKANKIFVTDKGKYFINLVPMNFKTTDFTSRIEDSLKDIEDGKLTKDMFLSHLDLEIKEMLTSVISLDVKESDKFVNTKKELGVCPLCGGKIVVNPKGYGCSNWKDKNCKFVIWKNVLGKNISDSVVSEILSKGKSKLIKGFKSKAGKSFDGYLKLKDDKTGVDIDFERKG